MKGVIVLPKPEHAMAAKKIYMTGTVVGEQKKGEYSMGYVVLLGS
jgi:hypothetical protein